MSLHTVAEAYVGKKKVPAEYTMTDGCGLANGDFFAALAENLSSEFRVFPTAVQVRINGAKVHLLQETSSYTDC